MNSLDSTMTQKKQKKNHEELWKYVLNAWKEQFRGS